MILSVMLVCDFRNGMILSVMVVCDIRKGDVGVRF